MLIITNPFQLQLTNSSNYRYCS